MTRLAGLACLLIASTLVVAGCGGGDDDAAVSPPGGAAGSSKGAGHVHGLGVNPSDDSLFIATHSGLFRLGPGTGRANRVGDSRQDTMGFTVMGPNRFLGSGHPGPGQAGPPNLGLIESTNAGRSWRPVSLSGEVDFHVLRAERKRVYGFDATSGRLMVSRDGGRTWRGQSPPGPLVDAAIDPTDPDRVVVSTDQGLASSRDAGGGWRPLSGQPGLLAWPRRDVLYHVDASGQVSASANRGRTWRSRGRIGGQPVALTAASPNDLYAALADGKVVSSGDGGRGWVVGTRLTG